MSWLKVTILPSMGLSILLVGNFCPGPFHDSPPYGPMLDLRDDTTKTIVRESWLDEDSFCVPKRLRRLVTEEHGPGN